MYGVLVLSLRLGTFVRLECFLVYVIPFQPALGGLGLKVMSCEDGLEATGLGGLDFGIKAC